MLILSSGIAGADQLIKHYISMFAQEDVIAVLPPMLEIVRNENSGAAFSMLSGNGVFLLTTTSIMLILLLLTMLCYHNVSGQARWAIASLLGGGVGNWIDRFTSGTVSDYIRLLFIRFPVFNLADIFITLSVAYLIVLLLMGRFELNTGENHGAGH